LLVAEDILAVDTLLVDIDILPDDDDVGEGADVAAVVDEGADGALHIIRKGKAIRGDVTYVAVLAPPTIHLGRSPGVEVVGLVELVGDEPAAALPYFGELLAGAVVNFAVDG
jgi:hypothetical protein